MSDHGSGPRATTDPVLDISDFYAFPSPERPGRFVLAMIVFPFASPQALFSDAVDYRFRIRPAQADRSGARPAFTVGNDERTISVTFNAPPASAVDHVIQTGTCVGPGGETIVFQVGDEAGARRTGCASSPAAGSIPSSSTRPSRAESGNRGGCRNNSAARTRSTVRMRSASSSKATFPRCSVRTLAPSLPPSPRRPPSVPRESGWNVSAVPKSRIS
jgi:Domain of unknown function (DUF4331)